ncbi:MAG: hypothetical protein AAFX58_07010 [Pseudomonadota bacterium]
MPDSDKKTVERIASEIARYLEDRPNAADTLEGVSKWWLMKQRFEESDELVCKALEKLVSESVVERKRNPDGTYVYFAASKSRDDVD